MVHQLNPGTGVENLIPDFNGIPDLLTEVFHSRPEVLAHNVETVPEFPSAFVLRSALNGPST